MIYNKVVIKVTEIKKAKKIPQPNAKKILRPNAKKLPEWIKNSPVALDRRGRELTQSEVDTIETMANMQCSVRMIAAVLNVTESTISDRYSHIIEPGKDRGKKMLIHCMWEKATVEKDTKMMIWLSKQYLGFKESWPDVPQSMTYNVNIVEVPR